MTVFLTTTETEDEVILQWYSTAANDIVENLNGISKQHFTLLATGRVSLQIDQDPPEEFTGPHIFILPLNTPYTFTVLEPAIIHCIYSKITGAADDIMHLVTGDTIIWNPTN